MKNKPAIISALIVLLATGLAAQENRIATQAADAAASTPTTESVVDAIFKDAIHPGQPGAAVLVAKDGRILFEKAYGLADVEHAIPVSVETKFNIASITKPFTAAAILKLQEEGRLSLDDPLSKYIPDYPRGNEIRIRHLLTHTSGIPEKLGGPATLATAFFPASQQYLITLFEYQPLDFDPGSQYAYSNSGYYLLGYIIEKVTGQGYLDFLRNTFFKPLGMEHTGIYAPGDSGKAMPYWYANGKLEGLQKAREGARVGANGVLDSTVEDLFRWSEGYMNARILSPATVQAAWTPSIQENTARSYERIAGYGYGWSIGRLRGVRQISHTGASGGYCSSLNIYPDEHLTIAILANSSCPIPTYGPSETAQVIAKLYLHDHLSQQNNLKPNPHIDVNVYNSYVGRYDQGFNGVIMVTKEGNRLFAQATGRPKIEVFPKTETIFTYDPKILDGQIEFLKDEQGMVVRAINDIEGEAVVIPRLPDLPSALLTAYVGHYRLSSGEIMTVTSAAGSLFGQIAGQPSFMLFPRSETKFFLTEAKVTVEFVKDANGAISKAVLEESGRTVEAPRIEVGAAANLAQPQTNTSSVAPVLQPQARQAAPILAIVIPMTGSYALHGEAMDMITAYMTSKRIQPMGPLFGRYLNSPAAVPESELRWEVGCPVPEGTTATAPFEVRKIDEPLVVSAVVEGALQQPKPWPELFQWIGKNGYVPVGPTMTNWLEGPATEMRIAVARKN
ncbi:MAG: serine hydrolase [Terracidiphilus sp.]|jgi:CubicO group peptidase (beta-lactamase class C family)